MRRERIFLLLLILATFAASAAAARAEAIPVLGYRVLNSYPHDGGAFTQGLVMADGVLYEGTGLHGRSSLRRVDLESGTVLQSRALPRQFFGEGVAVLGNRIIQLTWRSGFGFVYDRDTFALLRTFTYPAEGWGLTTDGRHLIASDGSAILRFLDPETFAEVRRLTVVDQDGPVTRLNELEYVAGSIYANVWQTDRIAVIDAASGRVTAWLDLRDLLPPEERTRPVDVLNGIAYDASNGRLYVTGKLWPRLYQIEPVPPPGSETRGGGR
ncbi:MAG: glutaminyl-peptide cyclotransferase [Thermodesulfobacteriota bacterium]